MNPGTASLREQLHLPDRAGRDLALLRTRVYRFSDDLRWYVLAESLEEQFLAGKQPKPSTMDTVRACLGRIREDGSIPAFPDSAAAAEGIDIQADLGERASHAWPWFTTGVRPATIVVIIGAPRSGTSHLFNLLAAAGRFSYFTTASCWAWPVRNLSQPARRAFTTLAESTVLTVDNKKTRIIPGLVMPGEAEDIWHRAMPVYRHIRGHRYDIGHGPQAGNPGVLEAAASAHLAYFHRDTLLVKSPFSSFRIPQLERCWGNKLRYVHIVRDQDETADSIRRNHFEFESNGRLLAAEDAWALFTGAVEANAPADRTVTIRQADLLHDPRSVLDALARQIP
jgi:Sulfotransferase family